MSRDLPRMKPVRIGIVTTSDRASRGEYEDKGTPELVAVLAEMVKTPFEPRVHLIADDFALIQKTLIDLADNDKCCLIVTTGGTGPAFRDVTVDATLSVGKIMPGFGELMRKVSLDKVPTAILSRQEAVIRRDNDGGSLIVNLPGSIKAIRECLIAVMPAIPYCIDLIGGPYLETHESIVKAFRPKSSAPPSGSPGTS